MPESKKISKAKAVKPKVVKAKPAPTARKGITTKPKANIKAPKRLKPLKVLKPDVKALPEVKVRKVQGPNKAKGSIADLLKKHAELEKIKKGAKADLKKQYDGHLKEAESIKAQFKSLFSESIESAPKNRGPRTQKAIGKVVGLKPFSLKEIEAFLEQKHHGIAKIKIQGRRPKSIARIEDAYRHSEHPEEILKILNQ
jgi:hypothetical protein